MHAKVDLLPAASKVSIPTVVPAAEVLQFPLADKAVATHSLDSLLRDLFDAKLYLWLYPDVAEAAAAPDFNPFRHFVDYGMKEGRDPSLFFNCAHVAAELSRIEGRDMAIGDAFMAFAQLPPKQRFVPNGWFSPWAFRTTHIAAHPGITGLPDYELFLYYLENCARHALSPSGLFNEAAYRDNYHDVADAIEANEVQSGFIHFIMSAKRETRRNLPGYGVGLPAGQNEPPPEPAFLLTRGGTGNVLWYFDEEFYLSVYPDIHLLKRQGRIGSGLEHFIVAGFTENRVPHPAAALVTLSVPAKDGWNFLARLARHAPPAGRTVSLATACLIRDQICQHGGDRQRITDAIWPFVEKPASRAAVDVDNYLAVNPDIAEFVKHDREAAQAHWETFGFAEKRAAPGTNLFANRNITLNAMLDWRDGVNFFGPLSSASGLGHAARGYLAAMRAAGIPVTAFDVSALLNATMPAELFHDRSLPYSINFFFINADQVLPFIRRYGSELMEHRANVAAWVWELPAPRPEWRAGLAAFDLIVVPSAFTAESFALFTDTPIQVVPYVLDAPALRAAAATVTPGRPLFERLAREKAAGRKIVLFIMDASSYTARKGLDIYERLAAHFETTRPGECVFVLKTHSRDYSLCNAERTRASRFLVVDGIMEFDDLCRLKAAADVYVSPHRSEGFGLNIFESLLLGVPVVCSDFGGPVGLLGPDNPNLISGRLTEIGREMGPYRAGAVWFEPDFGALATRLAAVLDAAPDSLDDQAAGLAETLSAAAIGARLRDVFETYCGYGHPGQEKPLERFLPLTQPRDERYTFAVPEQSGKPAPGRLTEIMTGSGKPFFSVITITRDTPPARLAALAEDLFNQSHPCWEWCIADDGSTAPETLAMLRALRRRDARILVRFSGDPRGAAAAANAAVRAAAGSYLLFADPADGLDPALLATYRTWIDGQTTGAMLYCDGEAGNLPGWSYDALLSRMYPRHGLCVRKEVFLQLGGYRAEMATAAAHDFVLRAAAAAVPAWHVGQKLVHRRASDEPAPDATAHGAQAVAEHLTRIGLTGRVEPTAPVTYRIRPALPAGPVSINILAETGGHGPNRESQAEALLRSILKHKPAQDFELRLIAPPDIAPGLAPLCRLARNITLAATPQGGPVNRAEMANFAVRAATTDRIILLRETLRAPDAGWLEALLEMLEVPGIGIAGGRLESPDGTLLHAGIALGGPNLLNFITPANDAQANTPAIRNFSVLCGSMLAFRRATYDLAGGFDESFAADYGDLDFCLKIGEAGLRVVYTPHARMLRPDSHAAPPTDSLDARRFARKWHELIHRDPFNTLARSRNA
jgi:glycosyltransferase involved in cell wall biosynthesis